MTAEASTCARCSELSRLWHEPSLCNEHLPRCQWGSHPKHEPEICIDQYRHEHSEMVAALRTMTNALLWITDQSDAGRLDAIERLHKDGTVIETARDLLARIDGAAR